MKRRLRGTFTALPTPFRKDGSIDWQAFDRSLEFQVNEGSDGVLPMGTTGESPTVDWDEHLRVINRTMRVINGRIIVLAGVGGNNTKEVLHAARVAVEDGALWLLILDAYYSKPASIQLRDEHHRPVAELVAEINPECGVVIYIIPGRTCCQLHPIDLAILAQDCPNVRAVKEATGELANMRQTRAVVDAVIGPQENFSILSGDDGITARMMTAEGLDGDGVISVMSNIVPNAITQMVHSFFELSQVKKGQVIADALAPLFGLVGVSVESARPGFENLGTVKDKFPNPCPVKTMMAGLGMGPGFMRSPMSFMSEPAVAQCRTVLQNLWASNPEFLAPIGEFYGVDVEGRLATDTIWEELCN